jgi:hypothetical protein
MLIRNGCEIMEIRNDEMIIWKGRGHMILKGSTAPGEFMITNKRMAFYAESKSTLLSRKNTSDIWDLSIERVIDVDTFEIKGLDHPVIRIRYSEDEVYFTLPESSPGSSLAAIRLFINAARRIENQMDLMRGVERSLKEDTLLSQGEIPELIKGVPKPADQVCFQCGKGLVDPPTFDLEDLRKCTVCEGTYR